MWISKKVRGPVCRTNLPGDWHGRELGIYLQGRGNNVRKTLLQGYSMKTAPASKRNGTTLSIQVLRCIISLYSLVRRATPGPIVRLRIGTLHTRPPSLPPHPCCSSCNSIRLAFHMVCAGEVLMVTDKWGFLLSLALGVWITTEISLRPQNVL